MNASYFGPARQGLPRQSALALVLLSWMVASPPVWAGTTDLSFGQVISGSVAGTAPWASVLISDTATADAFTFTVSGDLTGSQDVTGLFLDIPTAEAAKLTGISVSGSTSSGSPLAFVAGSATSGTNSVYSSSENITGLAGTTGSKFDLYVKLPAGVITGTSSETFTLTFAGADSGLTAASFLTASTPNNTTAVGGSQSPIAELSMTNSGGGAGAGVAYIAVSAVPEADTWATLVLSLGVCTLALRRRRQD